MSNLSDLLPAGGGAKVITATASGNLATGQTVALQSDGTVIAVADDGLSSSLGTAATYVSSVVDNAIAYDSTNNKILVAYKDNSTNKGMAVVGTISGTSISFGTAAEFSGNVTGDQFRRIAVCFNSTEGKFVIVYRDSTINNYGRARTATISGTSVSFGTSATFNTATTFSPTCAFDSTSNRVVIAYPYQSDGDGHAVVAKITGTDLSFGSEVEFETGYTHFPVAVYDSNADRTVIVYRDAGNSNYGTAIVATVSDMSISFGSAVVFESAQTEHQSAAYDSANYKIVIGYSDQGNSGYGTGIVGTVSGTSISFGSATVFESASTGTVQMQAAYNIAAGKTVIGYVDNGNGDYGTYVEATVSGTSLSFSSPAVFESAIVDRFPAVAAYDSSNKLVVFAYLDAGNSNAGTAIAYRSQASNSADFVGITNQAINNSASGEVVVEGGVITNGSLLPQAFSGSLGSEVVFESGTFTNSGMCYDTTNDKIVVVYADASNSDYGTAVVGTVSGTTVSFGTPVVFETAETINTSAAFDSSNGKVVIAYRDAGNSNYGTAIVGTVSGTSISFGTAVVFESATVQFTSSTFDSNSNKIVIAYRDAGNSSYGTSIVGTVSGTSISFGTPVVFNSGGSTIPTVTFDSSNNKVVVCYKTIPNNGNAKVGTVSGTSISFGSEANFSNSSTVGNELQVVFDSTANKVVVAYMDTGNSTYGTAAVGTVSGTSISFGSTSVFESAEVDEVKAAYDSSSNNTVISYMDVGNSNYGTYAIGTISGTSISFGTPAVFNAASVASVATAFDPDQGTVVIAYRDGGNSNQGTGIGLAVTGAVPNFTIGSTYYVQDDGTLATTSSSVTAGKAIANTTLLLKG